MARIWRPDFGPRLVRSAIWLLSIAVLAFGQQASYAGDPADVVKEHLAAGEFGPALAAANGVNDPARRDRLLGDIAAAQAGAGARRASLETAYDISSDTKRDSAIRSMLNDDAPRGRRGGMSM